MTQLPGRIAAKIETDDSTECWIWTAARDPHGYGRVQMGRKIGVKFAHRVIYTLLREDPGALSLDHLCRNTSCVNPDHLEPVTHTENVRRGVGSSTTKAYYAGRPCPQGHAMSGENLLLYKTRAGYINRQCRTCKNEQRRSARAASAAAAR